MQYLKKKKKRKIHNHLNVIALVMIAMLQTLKVISKELQPSTKWMDMEWNEFGKFQQWMFYKF